MFCSVGGAYFAMSGSCKTYLHHLWLSLSEGLLETEVFDKSVKLVKG